MTTTVLPESNLNTVPNNHTSVAEIVSPNVTEETTVSVAPLLAESEQDMDLGIPEVSLTSIFCAQEETSAEAERTLLDVLGVDVSLPPSLSLAASQANLAPDPLRLSKLENTASIPVVKV